MCSGIVTQSTRATIKRSQGFSSHVFRDCDTWIFYSTYQLDVSVPMCSGIVTSNRKRLYRHYQVSVPMCSEIVTGGIIVLIGITIVSVPMCSGIVTGQTYANDAKQSFSSHVFRDCDGRDGT